MNINNELFESKYQEMMLANLTEDYLDIKAFGELKMFIGIKPIIVMMTFKIGADDVYIGANKSEL